MHSKSWTHHLLCSSKRHFCVGLCVNYANKAGQECQIKMLIPLQNQSHSSTYKKNISQKTYSKINGIALITSFFNC